MLIKISGGSTGIVDYLEHGRKEGRDLDRNSLDERIPIQGDLDTLRSVLDNYSTPNKENYLHITLSFAEQIGESLSVDQIREITQKYKEHLMTAYLPEEYCFYAEIHIPKVTHETNSTNGKLIERLPHVHIVIPKKNLIDNSFLKPTDYNGSYIKYHNSFQEIINKEYSLKSPRYNKREQAINPLERHTDKEFTTAKEIRDTIINAVIKTGDYTLDNVYKIASGLGETKIRKGKEGDYVNVKPSWASKGINLKELTQDKLDTLKNSNRATEIDYKQDYKNIQEWTQKALEIRYLNTKKKQTDYNKLTPTEKLVFLVKQRNQSISKVKDYYGRNTRTYRDYAIFNNLYANYARKSKVNSGGARRNIEGSTKVGFDIQSVKYRNHHEQNFSNLARKRNRSTKRNGEDNLHELSQRHANAAKLENSNILSDYAHSKLSAGSKLNSPNVRWNRHHGERINAQSFSRITNDMSAVNIARKSYFSKMQENIANLKIELTPKEKIVTTSNKTNSINSLNYNQRFSDKTLKNNTDPKIVIDYIKKLGFDTSNFKSGIGKDNNPRIFVNGRQYNLGDIFTKHLNIDWNTTKKHLENCYIQSIQPKLSSDNVDWEEYKKYRKIEKDNYRSKRQVMFKEYKQILSNKKLLQMGYSKNQIKKIRDTEFLAKAVKRAELIVSQSKLKEQIKSTAKDKPSNDQLLAKSFLIHKANLMDVKSIEVLRKISRVEKDSNLLVTGKDKIVLLSDKISVANDGTIDYGNFKDTKNGISAKEPSLDTLEKIATLAVAKYGSSYVLNKNNAFTVVLEKEIKKVIALQPKESIIENKQQDNRSKNIDKVNPLSNEVKPSKDHKDRT